MANALNCLLSGPFPERFALEVQRGKAQGLQCEGKASRKRRSLSCASLTNRQWGPG